MNNCYRRPKLFMEPELYSPRTSAKKLWYDYVVEWARRSISLPSGKIPQEVRAWAAEIDAEKLVFTFARALFNAWVEADNLWDMMTA